INLGGREPIDVFAQRLGRWQKSLLILDGFDRLVESAGRWVQELLAQVARIDVLVTSRRRLKLAVESPCEIGPLVRHADAFFTDRLRSVMPGFEPDAEQRETISRIAQRLDCIPLGLEIAAAQADLLGLDGIESRLADHMLGLAHRGPLESSHSTLRDTISWAWELLQERERAALTQLAVFSGSFTLDAAEAIVVVEGDILSAVAELRDRSFLSTRGAGRLECYETVRRFVTEHGDPELLSQATERHRDWFLEKAESWASGANRGEGSEGLERLAEEVGNIRAIALQGCEDAHRWAQAARAAVAMRELWMSRGPIGRYVELLDRLVQDGPEESELLGLVLLARGASRRVTRRGDEAKADLQRATALLEGSSEHEGRAQNELAVYFHQHRDLESAREHYLRARAVAPPDTGFQANIEGNLGALAHDAAE
ncbi:MAG: hypothetical protein AAFQ82_25650, partial [Myxococcota bacterium]